MNAPNKRYLVVATFPGSTLEVPVVDAADGLTRHAAKSVVRVAKDQPGYEGANFRIVPFESPMGFQA